LLSQDQAHIMKRCAPEEEVLRWPSVRRRARGSQPQSAAPPKPPRRRPLAAFLSVRREFRGRPDEVKRVLLQTCTDLERDRYHQGRGMPNLMQMLLAV
jgi:hypothetical protein